MYIYTYVFYIYINIDICFYLQILYIYIYIYPCHLYLDKTNKYIPGVEKYGKDVASLLGCQGIFPFSKNMGFPRLPLWREWMMSNEKSRNLGGVDVFFVSNMFFSFFDCGFDPECLGRWSNLTMSLRWGANLPTWNSWGISKKKVLPNNWCMFFLNRNFGCSKGTSLCWHRDSRWL